MFFIIITIIIIFIIIKFIVTMVNNCQAAREILQWSP